MPNTKNFWAFVPAKKQEIPTIINLTWPLSDIDKFVLAKIEANEKSPKEKADNRTLIRRLSLDLTGLPPTLEEIGQFLADTSPNAYQKLVDRLLAKPAYGEHMAKYWLDLVRVADTNGNHHDHYRDHSSYRDWVIQAFNENLPYDQFTKYQIAGDLYEKPTQEQLIASGFNRLHLIIDRGTALPEESTSKTWLTVYPRLAPPLWASPSDVLSAMTTNTTPSPRRTSTKCMPSLTISMEPPNRWTQWPRLLPWPPTTIPGPSN